MIGSPSTRPTGTTQPGGPRGKWALRDQPAIGWLVAAVVVALLHPFVDDSHWLMVHMILLGAMTHAAIVWSTYFTQALLKTSEDVDPRRLQSTRIVLVIIGVLCVLVGVPTVHWPLVVAGATLVSGAVLWHAVALALRLRRSVARRFRTTVFYYLAAAVCVPVGAGFGTALAKGPGGDWHGRLMVAHSMTMLLGWLGLTVLGTLLTLWPTMLRTRMDDRAETLARQSLPIVIVGLIGIDSAAVMGLRAATVAGLLIYLAGVCWWGRALIRPVRTSPPRHASAYFVSAAVVWGAVTLVLVPVKVATAGSWAGVHEGYDAIATIAAVGFALQLLTGAMSHLVPVVIGGGAQVIRAAQTHFDRFAVARITVVNLGLLLWVTPTPPAIRDTAQVLVLLALVAIVPLMLLGITAAVRMRRQLADDHSLRGRKLGVDPGIWSPGQLVAGVAVLALAVSVAVAWNPAGVTSVNSAAGAAGSVQVTGKTTTVRVTANDMRFHPSSVTVPKGNKLVVVLTNTDSTTSHDIYFPNGAKAPLLSKGQTARVDVGVISKSMQGWCTVIGHRAMGMVFDVKVKASSATMADGSMDMSSGGTTSAIHPNTSVPASFRAADASLPPLTAATVHHVTLVVRNKKLQVAPGIWQTRWTYNGQVPGPTLHGRVGDTFVVKLINDGTMGHSIDFHAGDVSPDKPMRTIQPGQSLTYTFVAHRAGIWLYHCSTMPMSAHIAAGMAGAVIIDPPNLPAVDKSYVLVQSEAYVDGNGRSSVKEVNADAVAARTPSFITFNGMANQYDYRPLTAKAGERVRIWVLDAGPNEASSFHVVGTQFDTVYKEGGYLLKHGKDAFGDTDGGSQALDLEPAQGGFVEFTPPAAGTYSIVSHIMSDAEAGAHGYLRVTGK
ncbi:multicopper oxidase domain-containing protein [Flexivirga oryzae]|uniref:Copper-containing nitrite reductase n=1 Tax=Flexivirga oryzae TaxID=1794944 RepID=A0A839NEZ8_9MICO|nr:multicopper oxidase domain-containing protein [Flexivirga oryzae]MBB2894504.1 nitrite reductase (NO-forming) [Flexivirga oryzae]